MLARSDGKKAKMGITCSGGGVALGVVVRAAVPIRITGLVRLQKIPCALQLAAHFFRWVISAMWSAPGCIEPCSLADSIEVSKLVQDGMAWHNNQLTCC